MSGIISKKLIREASFSLNAFQEEQRKLLEIGGLSTISSDGFIKRAGISTPMFFDRFAGERTRQIGLFAQLPNPSFFIVQGFQDLHRDGVLLFFRENLNPA